MTHNGDIEALDACLQEAAKKLGQLLKQQSTLLRELDAASTEAESKGCPQFATIFRAMAAQVGAPANGPAKAEGATAKRRGRPAKPVGESSSESQQ